MMQAGNATLAPVEIIIFGLSFKKIKKISKKLKSNLTPFTPWETKYIFFLLLKYILEFIIKKNF